MGIINAKIRSHCPFYFSCVWISWSSSSASSCPSSSFRICFRCLSFDVCAFCFSSSCDAQMSFSFSYLHKLYCTSVLAAISCKMSWPPTSKTSLATFFGLSLPSFSASWVVLKLNFHFAGDESSVVEAKWKKAYSLTAEVASTPSKYSMNPYEYSLLWLFLTTTDYNCPYLLNLFCSSSSILLVGSSVNKYVRRLRD